jgi:hypothetical protein
MWCADITYSVVTATAIEGVFAGTIRQAQRLIGTLTSHDA